MHLRIAAVLGLLSAALVAAQAPSSYQAPRTPWGDPDLQGLWPGTVSIPLQRPASFGDRDTLTDEELKERDEQALGRAGRNWIEYFPAARQASLIVDPKNGRIPALTPEADARIKGMRGGLGPPSLGSVEKRADGPEDFDLWGRCITKGLIGSLVPGGLYNKGNRIVQAPGYVVLMNEMVHESRVIPLDGRPHVGEGIRMYMGDGRGHWEGDTLVVETTNFTGKTNVNAFDAASGPHTEALKMTERITRVGEDRLLWQVTIDDPQTWVRPWTLRIPFELDPDYELYEYACHEANYGMIDILKGARKEGR